MNIVAAVAVGAIVTVATLVRSRWLARPAHMRTNFRGRQVIAVGGVALCPGLVAGTVVAVAAADVVRTALVMLGSGLAIGVLGYVDDVYGDRHAGGLLGHARALLRGKLTTGMLKAAGGTLIGLASSWLVGWRSVWVLAAGAVVALSANLANLFDLRPGRVIKLWLPAAVVVGLAGGPEVLIVLAALGGGTTVFLRWELAERVMLGDTGAGLLGAVLGVAIVSSVGRGVLLTVVAVLALLTLASEIVSFTRVIEAVPPLRWLDEIGRAREG